MPREAHARAHAASGDEAVRTLLVLYDSECPLCERCRAWLEARPALVRLEFLCCRTDAAIARYGRIEGLGAELVVVADDGRYWVGPSAFAMCFWALEDWHDAGELLTGAWIWWLTSALFAFVTAHREVVGRYLGAPCHEGHCAPRAATGPYR